jgi:DNA-binding helix-hairpin-helix protein with protein kinase domain
MASAGDPDLLTYVAWPAETIHERHAGPVIGFLMQKVTGREPVHLVYSPAHRRRERPDVLWDFLLFVARNVAAAFETVHARGHVVGDVNQGNAMVGRDSRVLLIDADSYQVKTPRGVHYCEVGVSHFTPPELQGMRSFAGVERTPNHDNFGLALLVFHLLLGGRHPYSGVPLRSGIGEDLESSIKEYRYAYARDAQSRQLRPPPGSIPIDVLPDSVEAMFHAAFTERGRAGGRPLASAWVSAIDGVRARLKRCASSRAHLYGGHLARCPWCLLEAQGVVYFVAVGPQVAQPVTGFVLLRVWAQIEAMPAPPEPAIPNVSAIKVNPTPLAPGIGSSGTTSGWRALAVAVALAAFAAMPEAAVLIVIGLAWAWSIAGDAGGEARKAERQRRQAILNVAESQFRALSDGLRATAGVEAFNATRAKLSGARDEYQKLAQAEGRELDRLQSTARARQLKAFLDGFFIDSANIPGIGAGRRATLRSFGIETAADVERSRIRQIQGFGEALTSALMAWRSTCEQKFVFNPAQAVSEADKNVVRARTAARRLALEQLLSAGPAELDQLRRSAVAKAASMQVAIEEAATRLAQARKDMEVL